MLSATFRSDVSADTTKAKTRADMPVRHSITVGVLLKAIRLTFLLYSLLA